MLKISHKCCFRLSQEHLGATEEKEHNKQSGALTKDTSISQPLSFSSLSHTAPYLTPHPPPPVTHFPFPIPPFPPSVPPVPPRLPNGTIPIPPPGWIPSSGNHTSIPIPPPPIPRRPSIPPPPAFLGPPPPMMVPPSVPPPVHMYPLCTQPAGNLGKGNPPRHGSDPFPRVPWHAPPFPRFNPFVPPPHYAPVPEILHKVTIEKVLEVLMEELRSIIKKDITRRMIEGVAFKAFEDWWDCQEQKTKVGFLNHLLLTGPLQCLMAIHNTLLVLIIIFIVFIRYKFLL